MTIWTTAGSYDLTRSSSRSGQLAVVALVALVAAIPGAFIMSLAPAQPNMPGLCLASLTGSAVVALLAWVLRAERRTDYFNLWDAVGVYAFIGFGAGMLSKPEEILRLVGPS